MVSTLCSQVLFTQFGRVLRQSSVCKKLLFINASTSAPDSTVDYKISHAQPRIRGINLLKEPRYNKGMAFSLKERQVLGIHGLLPPAFLDQDTQALRVIENLQRQPDDLARYVQMTELQDRNERLFYKVLCEHIDLLLPIVYTPTVGQACQKFGFIYRRPKGLYITIHDNSIEKIYQILANWPERDVRAVVMTDGERILGLGDLGAYGMGIPVGKLALYVALAGVQPRWCLPICLDVGTDNTELLQDPFYIGCKHKRVRGAEYEKFIDNVMKALKQRYGQDTLIQFEDFGSQNALRLLGRYRNKYCMFNDDIQGTAAVVLAGLMAAIRVTGKPITEQKILFFGAGQASTGIAQLVVAEMEKQGMPRAEAHSRIWMMDKYGLLVKSRTDLWEHVRPFAQDQAEMTSLEDIVKFVKPTALFGAASATGAFTESIIRSMASWNQRPIIFALSNPTSNAECTAEQAYKFTDGRAVFASGSPFKPVNVGGKMFHPAQGNNAYIFPGVALGAMMCGIKHIKDEVFLAAAEALAGLVTEKHLEQGRCYPPLTDIREISVQIAKGVAENAYKEGLAAEYPEPEDKEQFIRARMYDFRYENFFPNLYEWPSDLMHPQHQSSA